MRDPELLALLDRLTPTARHRLVWPDGIHLEVAAYPTSTGLPADLVERLVTSVRCIVVVDDQIVDNRIVVCRAPDEQHIWPGGRHEPGETYQQTAQREVHEETGWQIDVDRLRLLGFLHFRHLRPLPADYPFQNPDFLQLVCTAPASRHAGGRPADWVDTEGWEQGHRLLTRRELADVPLSPVQRAFLSALDVPGHDAPDHDA